jgi:surface antigen
MGHRLRLVRAGALGVAAATLAIAGSTASADVRHVDRANVAVARARTGDYPYANAVCEFAAAGGSYCANPDNPAGDLYDWGYWRGGVFDFADRWGYEYRNCTSYVAWRLAAAGVSGRLFRDLGNAAQWLGAVRGEAGVVINHTPSADAVAVWEYGAYGHVAWVDSVRHGTVTVSDYNYAGTGAFAERQLNRADGPLAYIHFPRPRTRAERTSTSTSTSTSEHTTAKHSARRPG